MSQGTRIQPSGALLWALFAAACIAAGEPSLNAADRADNMVKMFAARFKWNDEHGYWERKK